MDCFPTLLAGLSLLFGYMEKTRVEALDPCMVATFSLFPCLAQIEHDAKEMYVSVLSLVMSGETLRFLAPRLECLSRSRFVVELTIVLRS